MKIRRFRLKSRLVPILVTVSVFSILVASPALGDSTTVDLALNFDGLEDLGPGWVYEGWLIVDGAPVSSGIFTVDSGGAMSESDFTVSVSDVDAVSAFVLTIEPSPDSDPGPSAVHVLAGDVVTGTASLSAGHGAALGDDFSGASGSYILAAPSAGEAGSYVNGIWWLDPDAGPGPSLVLPTLPDGWVYEGWVVGMDGPVSTGRFLSVSGADSDGAGPAGGSEPAPAFPGQDFVNPPSNLTAGYAAVISIEPEPDNSLGPFTFKPLVDMSIDDDGGGTLQAMVNNAEAFPTGTATIMTQILPTTGATSNLTGLALAAAAGGLILVGGAYLLRIRRT